MDIALCYESVLPARGGCETYIADLAKRLVSAGHTVHLYASAWDPRALSAGIYYHVVPAPRGPRFLRPWRFGAACLRSHAGARHDVSVGFNKTWGQDVLYPLAGLHIASAEHNIRKHRQPIVRGLARAVKACDLAHWSFSRLERQQYLAPRRPLIVVNSRFVQRHFEHYYSIPENQVRVVHNAVDPNRFAEEDRPRRRLQWRERWGIKPDETVALFIATNYHLKGLEALLHAVARLPAHKRLRLVIAGSPRTGPYERLAGKLAIADRVRFVGYIADTRNCYFASDFLVHPTFYDPCSLVVLEAVACGLPVITSSYNGAAELLKPPQDGYVIEDPHDNRRLAGCLLELLDPVRRMAWRRRPVAAPRWTFDRHFHQLMEVFQEAALRKQAA